MLSFSVNFCNQYKHSYNLYMRTVSITLFIKLVDFQGVLIAYRFALKPAIYGISGFGCLTSSLLLNKVGRHV